MSEMIFLKYAMIGFLGLGAGTVGVSLLSGKFSQLSRFFIWSITLAVFLGIYGYLIEPNWIEVRTVKIHDPRLAASLGDTRMVLIADIHLTKGLGFREKELIRKINRLNADLIFIAGDFIDHKNQVQAARELIGSLRAKQGIFGVPGNTDHIVMDSQMLVRELGPAGIDILVNEKRLLKLSNGHQLWLAGVDDPKYGYDNMNRTLGGIAPEEPKIVLAHCPDFIEKFYDEPALILAGDTHGGQVGIPFLIRLSTYARRAHYISGLFHKGQAQMYVNRGIGTKTLPIRFLCRPEITVFEVGK